MGKIFKFYVILVLLSIINIGTALFDIKQIVYDMLPDSRWITYVSIERGDIIKGDESQKIISTRINENELIADFHTRVVCNTDEGIMYNEDWNGYYPNIILTPTDGTGSLVSYRKPKDYPVGLCTSTILVDIHIGEYKKRLKPLVSNFRVYENNNTSGD